MNSIVPIKTHQDGISYICIAVHQLGGDCFVLLFLDQNMSWSMGLGSGYHTLRGTGQNPGEFGDDAQLIGGIAELRAGGKEGLGKI